MDEYNNQDRRMYPNQNQRFNANDNPYTRYDRMQGERSNFIDPANPLASNPAPQRAPYTPPQMPQRPVYQPQPQVPPQPIYPPQQMQQVPPQPMMGFGMTQGQASQQDYEDQFDYTRSNRPTQYPYPQQKEPPQKKKGLFAAFLGKNKAQPEYQPSYHQKGVIMQTPTRIDDIKQIIDMLRGGNTLVVDFSRINEKDSQRMIDYLSGAIYALGGVQKSIGDKKFIFTPEGTGITGQLN